MKLNVSELSAKFEAMAVRERVLLFLFAIIGPVCIWDYAYLTPLDKKQVSISSHVAELRGLSEDQTNKVKKAVKIASEDPDSSVRERLSRLRESLERSHVQLKGLTEQLISPAQMATVLQDMLKGDSGLRLVSLENLPIVAMGGAEDSEDIEAETTSDTATSTLLYQHSLRMEFEGTFKAAQTYLQALENMPWQLYWDAIEFDVVEYPVARVRMTVHTLSLGDGWIGV